MNENPDSEREESLIDAVLRDERWDAASAALKARALQSLRARRRIRRLTRWTGAIVAVAGAAVFASYWVSPPATIPEHTVVEPSAEYAEYAEEADSIYLSDEELLAMFPDGSGFLVEIDGQLELVILTPDGR